MKKITKCAALFLAVASIATTMSACSKTSSIDQIKKNGYVTMSTNAEFEPFEYKDGGNFAGIDIEISQAIAKKLGVTLKINDVAFDSLVAELQSSKANFVAAGMTASEDKKKNVDFSNTYFKASQSIIVAKDSNIKDRSGLAGKVVGVQQGTTGDIYCTDEDKTNKVNIKTVKRYNKGVDAVTDLLNGKIDAVVIDDFPAQKFVSKNADKIVKLPDALTVEEYAIAVKKGDAEMLKVVNDVLAQMQSDGSMDKLIEKYKSVLENK